MAPNSQPPTPDAPKPILILISGMPATGKSTLAKQLAEELGWPVLTKDHLKEVLFDAGAYDPATFDEAASDRLGTQAIALLKHLAQTMVVTRVNVILEANFRADLAARQFATLCEDADLRHVYCAVETERVLDRHEERLQDGERHPVHVDTGDADELAADLDAKDYGPIPLPIPTLIVRTEDGFAPPLAVIVAFCRS